MEPGGISVGRLFETNVLEQAAAQQKSHKEGKKIGRERNHGLEAQGHLAGAGAFESSELHYLRIPTIPHQEKNQPKFRILRSIQNLWKTLQVWKSGLRNSSTIQQHRLCGQNHQGGHQNPKKSADMHRKPNSSPGNRRFESVFVSPKSVSRWAWNAAYIRYLLFGDIQNKQFHYCWTHSRFDLCNRSRWSPTFTGQGPHDFNRKTFKMKAWDKTVRKDSGNFQFTIRQQFGVKEIFEIIQETWTKSAEVEEPTDDFSRNYPLGFHTRTLFSAKSWTQAHLKSVPLIWTWRTWWFESADLNNPTAARWAWRSLTKLLSLWIIAVQKLFSRIADLVLTKRQHEFLKGIAKPGKVLLLILKELSIPCDCSKQVPRLRKQLIRYKSSM